MPDFAPVFDALKPVLAAHAKRFVVKDDKPAVYTLDTKSPSPFPQHKGAPLSFGAVRVGKAYVSLHLVALYMNPALNQLVSPALSKRKQGMACFNFKTAPDAATLKELKQLTKVCIDDWKTKGWL